MKAKQKKTNTIVDFTVQENETVRVETEKVPCVITEKEFAERYDVIAEPPVEKVAE